MSSNDPNALSVYAFPLIFISLWGTSTLVTFTYIIIGESEPGLHSTLKYYGISAIMSNGLAVVAGPKWPSKFWWQSASRTLLSSKAA